MAENPQAKRKREKHTMSKNRGKKKKEREIKFLWRFEGARNSLDEGSGQIETGNNPQKR